MLVILRQRFWLMRVSARWEFLVHHVVRSNRSELGTQFVCCWRTLDV